MWMFHHIEAMKYGIRTGTVSSHLLGYQNLRWQWSRWPHREHHGQCFEPNHDVTLQCCKKKTLFTVMQNEHMDHDARADFDVHRFATCVLKAPAPPVAKAESTHKTTITTGSSHPTVSSHGFGPSGHPLMRRVPSLWEND